MAGLFNLARKEEEWKNSSNLKEKIEKIQANAKRKGVHKQRGPTNARKGNPKTQQELSITICNTLEGVNSSSNFPFYILGGYIRRCYTNSKLFSRTFNIFALYNLTHKLTENEYLRLLVECFIII
ncbi:hypothetical protein Cni_G15661 [Canna indica]|uniref:Uncharacterized protein n=1 Tax=Canna indica TaxID=4628 RepID=A0AAQ3KJX0_9LILI|nr:hypothetical protein Cni_G15661 [Canna indica]